MTLLARIRLRGACGVLLLGLLLGVTAGCQFFRRITGVTDSTAVAEQKSGQDSPAEPAPETAPPGAAVDSPPQPEAETPVEATPKATQPEPQPPQPEAETPAEAAVKANEPVPEVDEVSIVDPAEARLLSEDEEVPLPSLQLRVTRAETLSTTLQERELPEEMAAQVDSGRAFLQDAKEALNTGDLKRADVLIDKCLVLLEDAEQQTRP